MCRTRTKSIVQSAEAVRVRLNSYPPGTVDVTSSPNPLVAPQPGALLREWPADTRFVLRYEGAADGSDYTVEVYRPDGVTPAGDCSGI